MMSTLNKFKPDRNIQRVPIDDSTSINNVRYMDIHLNSEIDSSCTAEKTFELLIHKLQQFDIVCVALWKIFFFR